MNRTTVAVDLAKNRFELAIADSQCRIFQHERGSRPAMREPDPATLADPLFNQKSFPGSTIQPDPGHA